MFKNAPLPFHQNAMPAAKAAMAAHLQGKFWEMHDKLFANQQAMDPASMEKYASEIGLNVDKWKKDMESDKVKKMIEKDQADAQKAGASGTPTFLVNGKQIVGAQPVDAFKKMIDEELQKKK